MIDESAEPLPRKLHHGGARVVIVESDGGIDELVAVNYAFSIDAHIEFVAGIDRCELDDLPRQFNV